MNSNSHPAREKLRDFVLGKLPTEQADELSQHLEVCPNCEQTVAAFESESDTLLALLAAPPVSSEFVSESGYGRAAEFVRALGRDMTAPSTPPIDAPALGRLREYELLEKLGEGGMGAVYKARHTRLNKIVAVKVLARDRTASPSAVARFEREMLAGGSLDHPHLIRAHDAGEVDGTHFLVMEYIAGADLATIVKQHGRLAIADACELIRQAALGLQYAHEHGLVHRDIKPSNLILCRDGQVKVLDLGLALLQGQAVEANGRELTGAGQIMGTVDYMAPEQVGDSHRVDIRADIFSLGATLYKLLVGAAPFAGLADDTLINQFVALATAPHAPLAQRRPEAPSELGELLDRMLAKRPAGRPSTPAEVAAALAPFAQGHAVAALISSAPQLQTTGRPDTNCHLSSPDTGTARDLPSHGEAPTASFDQAGAAGQPPRSRRRNLLLAGAGGAALVSLAVWIIFLNDRDEEVLRIKAPDSVKKIVIVPDAPPPAAKVGEAANPNAPPFAIAPFSATLAREHQVAWAKYLGKRMEFANALGMKFALIPPGRFQMGSTQGDANEQPVHQVTISKPFYLGVYEVVQTEYEIVMGENPSKFNGPSLPVEFVTSDDATKFCQRLSERDGHVYRLPTEAEWEFACRAGTTTEWYFGNEPAAGVNYAWCKENGEGKTHPIGEKRPNPFGLYDMHGNVFEYCADYTAPYTTDPVIDPRGPTLGRYRGFRGGSWYFPRFDSRSADRQDKLWPLRGTHVGFRVLREIPLPDRMSGTESDDQSDWFSHVATLSAQEQINEVSRKLVELNPGFDGRMTGFDGQGAPRVDQGVVTSLGFDSEHVADLSPVRALAGLRELNCSSRFATKAGKVHDLSPLRGLKLTSLSCCDTHVADLTPLKEMPLTSLICYYSRVSDLSPLEGLRLKILWIGATETASLRPIQGMPLESLAFNSTQVNDISPIEGMPLTFICLTPQKIKQGVDLLRGMTSLQKIEIDGGQNWTPAEFWKKYDAGDFGPPVPRSQSATSEK